VAVKTPSVFRIMVFKFDRYLIMRFIEVTSRSISFPVFIVAVRAGEEIQFIHGSEVRLYLFNRPVKRDFPGVSGFRMSLGVFRLISMPFTCTMSADSEHLVNRKWENEKNRED